MNESKVLQQARKTIGRAPLWALVFFGLFILASCWWRAPVAYLGWISVFAISSAFLQCIAWRTRHSLLELAIPLAIITTSCLTDFRHKPTFIPMAFLFGAVHYSLIWLLRPWVMNFCRIEPTD